MTRRSAAGLKTPPSNPPFRPYRNPPPEAFRVSSPHIVHTSDSTFSQDVLKSDKPVLLDFWAEWCGPCKMIAPILDEIANEYQGKLKIAKLNIDENPELAAHFGVRSIPTLMIFKGGELADMKVGALPKTALSHWINGAIA